MTCGERILVLEHLVPPFPLEPGSEDSDLWGGTFSLRKGERVCLEARSGSGKTTLLHMLYGLRTGYEGELRLCGIRLKGCSLSEWARIRRDRLSMVFQDLRLFPDSTISANLRMRAELFGNEVSFDWESGACRLGLEGRLGDRCRVLSLGQQQRVAILRSLIGRFDLLLLDEPFAHLDQETAREAAALIAERVAELGAAWIRTSLGGSEPVEGERRLRL